MLFPDINTIKTRRQRLGIKQKELAKHSGVSQSLIAKLESGKIEPSYSIIKNIFSALDSFQNKGERTCGEAMIKSVLTVKSTDSIEKASHILKSKGISQIPVLSGKAVVGSISESAILNSLLEFPKKELFKKQVKEIMESPFPIVSAETPLSSILPLLKTNSAVLVSDKQRIAGIITRSDVF